MALEGLLDAGLPLNRKERFFTGTVFPVIVLADEARLFDRFKSPDRRLLRAADRMGAQGSRSLKAL